MSSVLQCVAVYSNALQYAVQEERYMYAVQEERSSLALHWEMTKVLEQSLAVSCCVLRRVAVCCTLLQCVVQKERGPWLFVDRGKRCFICVERKDVVDSIPLYILNLFFFTSSTLRTWSYIQSTCLLYCFPCNCCRDREGEKGRAKDRRKQLVIPCSYLEKRQSTGIIPQYSHIGMRGYALVSRRVWIKLKRNTLQKSPT